MKRIHRTVPAYTATTTVNTLHINNTTLHITNTYIKKLLRSTCALFGGKHAFGFDRSKIGNKSIRSGAAMALFLMDVSTAKIMILGRWSSDAFLVYIRPQVLEWTNNMSRDMVHLDSFFDASYSRDYTPDDPRLRRRLRPVHGSLLVPRLHLNH
jgi:hypothetical protein